MQQTRPRVPETLTIRPRLSSQLWRGVWLTVFLLGAAYAWQIGERLWSFAMLAVALFGPLRILLNCGPVTIGPEGVTRRTGLRTRRMRWSEVQFADFELDRVSVGGVVILRSKDDRRLVIPFHDDWKWPTDGGDTASELLGPLLVAERHLKRWGIPVFLGLKPWSSAPVNDDAVPPSLGDSE